MGNTQGIWTLKDALLILNVLNADESVATAKRHCKRHC